MNETDKLIAEQLRKLPSPLQKAIEVVPWKSSIKEIALSNNVPLDKIDAVEQETLVVVYEFDDPANYISNLVTQAGLEEGVAISIAETAAEKIFKKIYELADQNEAQEAQKSVLSPGPINKKEIAEQLAQRVQAAKQGGVRPAISIAPSNLPMAEKGKVAHDVPPLKPTVEKPVQPEQKEVAKPNVQTDTQEAKTAPVLEKKPEYNIPPINENKSAQTTPKPLISVDKPANPRYPAGKDPYREPIE